MEYAPAIDWALARRASAFAARDLPPLGWRELRRDVAGMRVAARRAGELAARFLGVESAGAGTVCVVDWEGWLGAVRSMAESVVAEVGLPARPDGALTRARALGNGLAVGLVARRLSRRLLGQYDAFSGNDVLYLVAPTIVAHELNHGFDPADFRLWVSLHEQTHALQLRAAPWLRAHLRDLAAELLSDESSLAQGVSRWLRSRDPGALVAAGSGAEALARLTAVMTFLEGHADHTADEAGRGIVRSQAALRRAFERHPGRFARAAGSLDKGAQYRDGLRFCRQVARRRGNRGLRAAFVEPEALPTPAEIADPEAWVRRVHG